MATKYDNIRYLPGLIREVCAHGIETDADSINRMSEIVNASPDNALLHYASGEDEFGNSPDTDEQNKVAAANQTALYSILFYVWGWNKTVDFYLKHSAPEKSRNKKLHEKIDILEAKVKMLKKALDNAARENLKLIRESEAMETEFNETKTEITHLKAYMYDLLMTIESMKSEKGETSDGS